MAPYIEAIHSQHQLCYTVSVQLYIYFLWPCFSSRSINFENYASLECEIMTLIVKILCCQFCLFLSTPKLAIALKCTNIFHTLMFFNTLAVCSLWFVKCLQSLLCTILSQAEVYLLKLKCCVGCCVLHLNWTVALSRC